MKMRILAALVAVAFSMLPISATAAPATFTGNIAVPSGSSVTLATGATTSVAGVTGTGFAQLNPASAQSGAISISGSITASATAVTGSIVPAAGNAAFGSDGTNGLFRLGSVGQYYFQNSTGSAQYGINAGTVSVNGGYTGGGSLGDIGGARSANSASYWFGSNSGGTAGAINYGVCVAGQYSLVDSSGCNSAHPLAVGDSLTGTTAAYVPPVYNASGAALASTTHVATGTATVSYTSGNILASATVAFSAASVFAGSYQVFFTMAGLPTAGQAFTPWVSGVSGTGFTLELTPQGTFAATNAITVNWLAIGS